MTKITPGMQSVLDSLQRQGGTAKFNGRAEQQIARLEALGLVEVVDTDIVGIGGTFKSSMLYTVRLTTFPNFLGSRG